MERLVDFLVEDQERALRRAEDQATNEARRLRQAAEDHVAQLEAAASDLGRVRGEAHEAAVEAEADVEIQSVRDQAFDALAERFARRVQLGLEALPGTDGYADALAGWAAQARAQMDGPAEVYCAKRDRAAVYEALLAAGAEDFQVLTDHRTHGGFVVRDLEGRTVADQRPAALVAAGRAALDALLRAEGPAPDAAILATGEGTPSP